MLATSRDRSGAFVILGLAVVGGAAAVLAARQPAPAQSQPQPTASGTIPPCPYVCVCTGS